VWNPYSSAIPLYNRDVEHFSAILLIFQQTIPLRQVGQLKFRVISITVQLSGNKKLAGVSFKLFSGMKELLKE
jgi:hypothetical protein